MKWSLIGIVVMLASLSAQDTPKSAVAPAAVTVPQVPDDAKNQYATLQIRGAGLSDAMALLQKELDSVNAERARLIQRLAAAQPDFDLVQSSGLTVAYAAKKKNDPKGK